VDYLYQAIACLAAFHHSHGYTNLIVNYVFESPAELADLRARLAEIDPDIYAYRLVCTPEELERRVRARALASSDAQELAWEVQRCHQLAEIQNQAARLGDLGIVVDTSLLSAFQAAQAIYADRHTPVELAPYDPAWAEAFQVEKAKVAAALGDLALEIHHVGSTAVPGLAAKPVIDILVAVRRFEAALDCIGPLLDLVYAFVDHPENVDRRFFRKGVPRTHHLHIVAAGSPVYHDHLDFCAALRTHSVQRDAYGRLKTELAQRYRTQRASYTQAKTAFVHQVLESWRKAPGYPAQTGSS
jgi:GrpB-like predicted nucleotidyltransferase (UPF0157 family)